MSAAVSVTRARALGVLTAISAAAVLAGPTSVAVPAGLLLAFALPGLALTGVLFRGRDLAAVERVVLAPAMSLATLMIAGLLMNLLGIGLDRTSWTAATVGVTLLALFSGALPARTAARTAGAAPPAVAPDDTPRLVVVNGVEAGGPKRSPDVTPADVTPAEGHAGPDGTGDTVRPLWRQLLPLAFVLVIAGGAGWLSYDSSRTSADRQVTTLSAAPPGAAAADGSRPVTVTASGLLPDKGPYTVDMRDAAGRRLDSRIVNPVDGAWSVQLSVPGGQRVTIRLLAAGQSTPYRTVIIAAVP